jgi:hypothetical protein
MRRVIDVAFFRSLAAAKRLSIASNSAQPSRVGVRPRKWQRNERHESDAANPVDDKRDMQRGGDFNIVDHGC